MKSALFLSPTQVVLSGFMPSFNVGSHNNLWLLQSGMKRHFISLKYNVEIYHVLFFQLNWCIQNDNLILTWANCGCPKIPAPPPATMAGFRPPAIIPGITAFGSPPFIPANPPFKPTNPPFIPANPAIGAPLPPNSPAAANNLSVCVKGEEEHLLWTMIQFKVVH